MLAVIPGRETLIPFHFPLCRTNIAQEKGVVKSASFLEDFGVEGKGTGAGEDQGEGHEHEG